MIAIKTNNLTKKFDTLTAVKDISLEIEEGELFALLGINGAGKSTTINMLTGLLLPTSGDAEVFGYSITKELNKIKPFVDISMQETSIARRLTVRENLAFYAELNGLSKEKTKEITQEICSSFGLDEVIDKRSDKLSGGYKRKLSVALALVKQPKILFLDEPTLGMDVIARRELWRIISKLKGKTTVLLTTHYMEEAEHLADRIGIMKGGELLFVGTKDELYAQTGKTSVEEAFLKIVEGDDYE